MDYHPRLRSRHLSTVGMSRVGVMDIDRSLLYRYRWKDHRAQIDNGFDECTIFPLLHNYPCRH